MLNVKVVDTDEQIKERLKALSKEQLINHVFEMKQLERRSKKETEKKEQYQPPSLVEKNQRCVAHIESKISSSAGNQMKDQEVMQRSQSKSGSVMW